MCVPAAARAWTGEWSVNRSAAARVLLSGAACGLLSLMGFGLAHAVAIVPIWTRMAGGIPFAIAAGTALAWAFDRAMRDRRRQSIGFGVQFGAVMFLTLMPATALDVALRVNGLHANGWWEALAESGLAIAAGAAAGWALTRRPDASFAFAGAALILMLTTAGPLPVAQSVRGAWLSLGIAPICVVAGAALAFLHASFPHEGPV